MRLFRIALVLSAAAWTLVFFWLGGQSEPFWKGYSLRGRQADYYNLLVEGFMKGQLSLNKEVDPGLLSPDPAVRAKAPQLQDAALFRGKYYIYYGVTPAVLVLLPYSLLTHQEMGLEVACLLFVLAGLGISALWLDSMRRWYSASWGPGFAVIAISVLAAVPAATFLVRRSSVYDLPIAAEYAFSCAFWFALFSAWRSKAPGSWIAAASLIFGLLVGCRPNTILLGPLLLAFVWIKCRESGGRPFRLLVPAIVPALMVGGLLAWYNEARFGSPFDFGFSHGQNWFFASGNPLLSPRFFPVNAAWYLFTPPTLAPRFPFDFPILGAAIPSRYSYPEGMSGFLPDTLLAAFAIGAVLFARINTRDPARSLFRALGYLLLCASLLEIGVIFPLGIRAYRYAAEFLTPISFLVVLGLGALWRTSGWSSGALRCAAACLVGLASVHAILGAVQLQDDFRYGRPLEYAAWSWLLNPRQSTMERLGFRKPGPMAIQVRFARPAEAEQVDLLSTGIKDEFDSLRAMVLPGGTVSFDVYHGGYGGPSSGQIHVEWGHSYAVEVSMGSLYPEPSDPYFAGWSQGSIDRVKSLVWVSFAGATVLDTESAFFPGTPGPRFAGGAPWRAGQPAQAASVDSLELLDPWPRDILAPPAEASAFYDLRLRLGPSPGALAMPVLSEGVTGNGNLLLIEALPSGRLRLSVDEWGADLERGQEFQPKAEGGCALQVMLGAALPFDSDSKRMLTKSELHSLRDRILVWADGVLVGNFQLRYHPDALSPVVIGRNDPGFSSASARFSSEMREQAIPGDAKRNLLITARSVPRP